jgi:hypothetical protein
MRAIRSCLPMICFAIVGPALLAAQGHLADYQRAEKLLPWNIRKLVFEADVLPNWIEHTNRFWYENVKTWPARVCYSRRRAQHADSRLRSLEARRRALSSSQQALFSY